MLEETSHHWQTGELKPLFGRRINFQIEIPDPESLAKSLKQSGISLLRDNLIFQPQHFRGFTRKSEILLPDGQRSIFLPSACRVFKHLSTSDRQ